MLKKRYLFLIIILCLFLISAVNAEKIDNHTLDKNDQLSINIDENNEICQSCENNFTLSNEPDELTSKSADDSSLKATNNVIYFDSSAKTNGDGSKTNPYKYINQNTLSKYINSENTLTAYFANGIYDLNTNFIIKSPNVILIGENRDNTIFNSVLSNKYDFEIMQNSNLNLANITLNHINIINHGTLQAYDALFEHTESFTGKKVPSTYNTDDYDSSYGGAIICDPIGNSNPYVYLENCIFGNTTAYCGGAISLKNSRLIANKTNFYMSKAQRKGGVIYAINSDITLLNSYTYSNTAHYGGVIYCEESNVDLIKTDFIFSEAYSSGGVVAAKYSNINIESSYFEIYYSMTDAGGAINNFKGNLIINDTTFYRGSAEFGAAICNLESNLNISSSFFENNTAGHGGAIYNIYGKMNIENNIFRNSSAYYGSAICSKLSDTSFIINNTFINSPTRQNASCIYLDYCSKDTVQYGNHFEDRFYIQIQLFDYLNDNEFVLNSNILTYAVSNDGIYYDNYYENIDSNGNVNNYASLKIYDSEYPNNSTIFGNYNDNFTFIFNLTTSIDKFYNPMFKTNVYNYGWDIIEEIPGNVENNNLHSGTCAFPFTLKYHMFLNINTRLVVENVLVSSIDTPSSDVKNIPSSYNSRDYGYTTPVKDQAEGGNCWAFAGIATLETCIKKITNIDYDFSEENVKNMMSSFSPMGLDLKPNEGGYDSMVMGYLTSWFGPVLEEADKYDDLSSLSNAFIPQFHIQNIKFLPQRENGKYDYLYKKAIMDYGAVAITFQWANSGLHSVSLVGWDDNYYNYDSLGTYTKGAWIFKNSWGTDWGDNGYGYLSYNTQFASDKYNYWHAYTFIFNNDDNYIVNVNPDYSGVSDYICNDGPISILMKVNGPAHYFAKLSAFATYFKVPTDYIFEIYDLDTGGYLFYQEGHSDAGYFTIPLYKTINMDPGETFLFKLTFNNEGMNYLPVCQAEELTQAHFQEAGQFFIDDGYRTADLINLKGYYEFLYSGTRANTCQVPSIHLFSNGYQFHETVIDVTKINTVKAGEKIKINIAFSDVWSMDNLYSDTIKMIDGSLVTININGQYYYAKIKDGKASLEVSFNKGGTYTLTAEYKNNQFKSNVVTYNFKVKGNAVITAKTVSKVYGGNEKSTITLKDNEGNPIPNTEITYNINGKSTTIKTNSKGQATMDISLAPKTYTATISYGGSEKYSGTKTTAKVVVKKATPKLIAKKATFKLKAKTKKYTVTLKNNKNQAMKNTKITLTIKNKKYTAKTNKKGVATFKLKINKKGTHKATITYAGNAYYNKVAKKVTITVKK